MVGKTPLHCCPLKLDETEHEKYEHVYNAMAIAAIIKKCVIGFVVVALAGVEEQTGR